MICDKCSAEMIPQTLGLTEVHCLACGHTIKDAIYMEDKRKVAMAPAIPGNKPAGSDAWHCPYCGRVVIADDFAVDDCTKEKP